jgi:hypothetical protein
MHLARVLLAAAAATAGAPAALAPAAATPAAVAPGKYTEKELDQLAATVRVDGAVLLRGVLDTGKLARIRAAFKPVLAARIARDGPDRGPGRYYATPPFVPPFFDPEIFQHPDILGVVSRLVGTDAVLCQWAADTPHLGSQYQQVHRDAAPLYTDPGFPEPPPTQLAVNFPLVDVLPPQGNGPTEWIRGTHRLTVAEGDALIAGPAKALRLEPQYMALGDVLVRDVRGLHRGTPNLSEEPREMVVVGYSRSWLRRPEVGIRVKQSLYDGLDEVGRSLLRFEDIVADDEFGDWPGEGWSPRYDSAMLEMTSGASYKEQREKKADEL